MKNVTFKTRHALVLSCISLMTCFAMLLGTTFAWFTDSVTSGVNRIVSGNLDVTLTHKGAEANATEQNVNENTKLFVSTLGDYLLWEPEAMSYETFTVGNAGTLALKYQLALVNAGNNTVTRDSTTKSLLDVIKVAVINDATNGITRELIKTKATMTLKDFIGSVNNTSGILYPSTDTDTNHAKTRTFTVALYWPQSEGDNFYNLKDGKLANDGGKELYVDLGITLVATQVQNESDSFGPNYDANSTYPSATVQGTAATVTTNSATTTATTNNNNTVTATATVAAVPADNSSESTKVTLTAAGGNDAAFEANDTVKLDVTTSNVVASSNTITVSGTDAESKTAVASIDLTLTKITTTEAGTTETALTRGFTAEVTTYIAKGLSDVSVKYNGTGEEPTDVTYEASTGKLTFKTTHFSEYYVTASNKAYIVDTNTAYATLAAAFNAAADGGSIILLKDVDLVAIDKNVKVVGNGTTVVDTKNVVTSTIQTLKNVTFENIVFKSTSGWTMNNSSGVDWTGIFSTNTTLDNVTFKNCTFSTRNDNKTNCIYNATINNGATFDGCTIYGDTYGINFAYVNGTLTLKNCDISGWNSFGSGTNSKVVIENSTFHKSIYNKLRFYQNADVTNCTFDSKFLKSDMYGEIYNYGEFKAGIDVNANDVTVKLANCSVKDASAGTQANLTEEYTKTCDGKTGVTFTISSVSTPDSE